MRVVDTNRINHIVVVDSLRPGDAQTARRLFEDIETICDACEGAVSASYHPIESSVDLLGFLRDCVAATQGGDMWPFLHIECHGNDDGFEFADGSFLQWADLKVPLGNLNGASAVNLMITVAACTGGALAKVVRLSDRAPFWGMIGPTRKLFPNELEQAYRVFFEALLRRREPQLAVSALNDSAGHGAFFRTTAQGLFSTVHRVYTETHQSYEELQRRARRMANEADRRGLPVLTEDRYSQLLVERALEYFAQCWRHYFFFDQYPEHQTRFPIPSFESQSGDISIE